MLSEHGRLTAPFFGEVRDTDPRDLATGLDLDGSGSNVWKVGARGWSRSIAVDRIGREQVAGGWMHRVRLDQKRRPPQATGVGQLQGRGRARDVVGFFFRVSIPLETRRGGAGGEGRARRRGRARSARSDASLSSVRRRDEARKSPPFGPRRARGESIEMQRALVLPCDGPDTA